LTCLVAGLGCVTPTPFFREDVSGNLLARTGYDLGPPKSICDLVLEEWVDLEDGLSEDEAIVIGLWNNPAYQELLADLQISQADLLQAAQLQNPQVSTMLPLGVKQWEFALLVPLDALWLRPLRVTAAELESHRVAERLAQDGLNVVRDVRVAYIDWQLAVQRSSLTQEGASLRHEIARVAEARLEAGDIAELDVAAVRLDALISTGDASRATRDVELAEHRLRYLLGIQLSDLRLSPTPAGAMAPPNFDREILVHEAIAGRPDLLAVQMAVSAAEERAALASRDIWQLNGFLPDINARGVKGFEAGPGLRFSVPVFHQNQGAIAQAEADAERLRRQYVNRRDLAVWEVRQAHTQLLQATTDLNIWRDQVLPQAGDAVNSSRLALQENSVSLLLVLETTRQLLNAQQREREADAQVRRAIAELERSVGHRLIDHYRSVNASAEVGQPAYHAGTAPDELIPVPPVDVREETQ